MEECLSKPKKEQIEFARTMNARQRRTLRVLAEYPSYLSASEVADPELHDLIRHKLARTQPTNPESSGPWLWFATDEGKVIARKQAAGAL
jgi:hypothetical protein